MKKNYYSLRLMRPVFQTSVVEVQSYDPFQAILAALEKANHINNNDWQTLSFNSRDYSTHVHSMIDHQNIYETTELPHKEIMKGLSQITHFGGYHGSYAEEPSQQVQTGSSD